MFSDPLKLIPLAMCIVAGVGLAMGRLTSVEAIGILAAAGAIHGGTSAVNNVNPK